MAGIVSGRAVVKSVERRRTKLLHRTRARSESSTTVQWTLPPKTSRALIQDLKREGKIRPIAIKPDRDKIVRLEAQSAVIEAGHVLLPMSAPWLDDFLLEVLAFPYGRFDDQVDSLSQFLTWAPRSPSRFHVLVL